MSRMRMLLHSHLHDLSLPSLPLPSVVDLDVRLAGLSWLGEGEGNLSEESSDEEASPGSSALPSRALPPSLDRRAEERATWDLLTRPDGFSVSRVYRTFVALHGEPNEYWLPALLDPRSDLFVLYAPSFDKPRLEHDGVYLAPQGWGGGLQPSAALGLRHIYVRRRWPSPLPLPDAQPSSRLATALSCISEAAPFDPASSAVRLAHAGAAEVPSRQEYAMHKPGAFTVQRLERRPDAECAITPMPRCNIALSIACDMAPPEDQDELVAFDVREVITARGIRIIRERNKREQRMFKLAAGGNFTAARQAKPLDLTLPWREFTRPAFRGVIMDFSVYPFRSLQPSRWPDRPPSTDLHIRAFRREFRSHPSFPNRQLRGMLSHGTPAFGEAKRVSHIASPHSSALRHFHVFREKCAGEISNGWARVGFPLSLELATWPARKVPASIAWRHPGDSARSIQPSGPRLCTDLSWPKPGTADGVDSPNDASRAAITAVKFVRLADFCVACAVFLTVGVPIRIWKLDLVAAYKRTPQQRLTRWFRQYATPEGTQTLDRVSFGQSDGPYSFSEQTNLLRFLIVREIRYADACYPTRDPRIISFLLFRKEWFGFSDGAELSLAFLMVLIDDFGGLSFADPLWRSDGSRVTEPNGTQTTRDWLHWRVATSVILRVGHSIDPSKLDKCTPPTCRMVLVGGCIDIGQRESLSLDAEKRERYRTLLAVVLGEPSISPTTLTSVAFKMLVVCEVYPLGRQWLHSAFRALRAHRFSSSITWADVSEVRSDLESFLHLLRGNEPLEIPLACRHSFPFDGQPELIVKYDDASGDSFSTEREGNLPGFGAWTVREGTLYYIHGLWAEAELVMSISVREYLISLFSTDAFSTRFPDATHVLEFTDNTGVEWSARREVAQRELMQRVTSRRSHLLHERALIPRTVRVGSTGNTWADDLSRQRIARVLAHARALGLACEEVSLVPAVRDTSWILAHARRAASARL